MNILDDIKMQYKAGGIAQRLIYWNVGCFIAAIILFYDFQSQNFLYPSWIALNSDVSNFLIFTWTFLSYSFFHDGFFHLFFNMIILNFASQLFLTFFTQKQLLGVYILCISCLSTFIVLKASIYFPVLNKNSFSSLDKLS